MPNAWIGIVQLHDSHNFRSFRGMLYCTRCCCYFTEKMQNLGKPCAVGPNGRATGAGLKNLKKISKGLLPQ